MFTSNCLLDLVRQFSLKLCELHTPRAIPFRVKMSFGLHVDVFGTYVKQ